MSHAHIRSLVVAALLSVCAAGSGCYADVRAEPSVVDGYEPQYYDGYVVYYDGGGRPFYYVNGATVFVPQTSPYYNGYVNHWRTSGHGYNRWYGRQGRRYQTYRAAPGRYYYRR